MACPSCGSRLRVPDGAKPGARAKCPKCGTSVPLTAAAPPPEPRPGPPPLPVQDGADRVDDGADDVQPARRRLTPAMVLGLAGAALVVLLLGVTAAVLVWWANREPKAAEATILDPAPVIQQKEKEAPVPTDQLEIERRTEARLKEEDDRLVRLESQHRRRFNDQTWQSIQWIRDKMRAGKYTDVGNEDIEFVVLNQDLFNKIRFLQMARARAEWAGGDTVASLLGLDGDKDLRFEFIYNLGLEHLIVAKEICTILRHAAKSGLSVLSKSEKATIADYARFLKKLN